MRKTIRPFTVAILCINLISPVTMGADPPDDTSPRIFNIEFNVIGDSYFDLSWETDEPAVGGIEYGFDRQYGHVVEETGNYSTNHYMNITNLTRDTFYYIKIFAIDEDGNVGTNEDFSVGTYPWGVDEKTPGFVLYLGLLLMGILIFIVVKVVMMRTKDRPDGP